MHLTDSFSSVCQSGLGGSGAASSSDEELDAEDDMTGTHALSQHGQKLTLAGLTLFPVVFPI